MFRRILKFNWAKSSNTSAILSVAQENVRRTAYFFLSFLSFRVENFLLLSSSNKINELVLASLHSWPLFFRRIQTKRSPQNTRNHTQKKKTIFLPFCVASRFSCSDFDSVRVNPKNRNSICTIHVKTNTILSKTKSKKSFPSCIDVDGKQNPKK